MHRWYPLAGVLLGMLIVVGCVEVAPTPEDESDTPPPAEAPVEDTPPADANAAPADAGTSGAEDDGTTAEDTAAEAPSGNGAQAATEIQAAYWLNTDPLSLEGLRGKIVVLEFWATWCPPCRTTIPHLAEMYNAYKDKGVALVSLTNEPRETVEPFVEKMDMPYPVGGGSPSGRAYGVRGIPHAFIVSPAGKVVWEGHPMGGLAEALEKQLEATPPK